MYVTSYRFSCRVRSSSILKMADCQQPSTSGSRRTRKRTSLSGSVLENIFQNDESDLDITDEGSESDFSAGESEASASESEMEEPSEEPRPKRACSEAMFEWKDGSFCPAIHSFDDSLSGINFRHFHPDENTTEVDFFKQVLSLNVLEKIVSETNRYAANAISSVGVLPKFSRLQKWNDVSVDEMFEFLAVTMLMVRNKKLTLQEYWSKDPLIHSQIFSSIMPRDRYLIILSMLHFCNNEQQPEGDRLFKVREIFELIKHNFRTLFYPFQNLCIDESIVVFKGRLLFKQYIKNKRHRFGIKLFVLCDVQTGFVLDLIVYTGKETDLTVDEKLGISGSLVMTLTEPYLGRGHSIYTDNWYTSPSLSSALHAKNTNSCGTVNLRRKGMPQLNQPKKLKKGDRQSKSTNCMMALRWQDKREVRMLTTLHKDEMKETGKKNRRTGENLMKPSCIIDYNHNMGSVDRTDMMLSSLETLRKSMKWYKKLFFHLLDLCLLNAHAMYVLHTKKPVSLAAFQLEAIRQLLESHHHTTRLHSAGGRTVTDMPLRLTERHFPKLIPSTPKRKDAMRKCHVCSHTALGPKKRKESRYMCIECNVGLCVDPCFATYHTLVKY